MTNEALGWSPLFQRAYEPLQTKGSMPARIARDDGMSYVAYAEGGEYIAELRGRFYQEAHEKSSFPAVGDWVVLSSHEEGRATIEHMLPRQSAFIRKTPGKVMEEQVLAANIDFAFLVMGADRDFNLRRLERYITFTQKSGAAPIVVLNKVDLASDVAALEEEIVSVAGAIPVIPVCATEGRGTDALTRYLITGTTGVLLGSSGVGKSTIINALFGEERQKVSAINEVYGKGRHTTTHRELLLVPTGGVLIDTPGIRELQALCDEDAVSDAFDDVEAIAANCRFSDCRHESEPGCAVRAAIEQGDLDEMRVANYRKMRKEQAYLMEKHDERGRKNKKARRKEIAKHRRMLNKHHKKR